MGIQSFLNPRAASTRAQAWATLLGLLAFVSAGAVAGFAYPGGTHWDRQTVGFRSENFWCDLLRPIALDGADNGIGARAAQIALLSLALGLGPFFTLAREELGLVGWSRLLVTLGAWGGRIALILVAAGTGRLPSKVHDFAILLGGPPGLLALCLVVIWSARVARFLPILGGTSLALGLWNLLQYAREALLRAPSWPGLPIVQKAATLGIIAFLALFAAQSLRRREPTPGD